jgi:hypothetical protein
MTTSTRQKDAEVATVACPYLRPADADDGGVLHPSGLICALRKAQLRAPSTDERRWFCTNGGHHRCPTYRTSRLAARLGSF